MLAVTSMYQSDFLSVTRWFEMTEKTQEDEITEKINNIEIHYNVMALPE